MDHTELPPAAAIDDIFAPIELLLFELEQEMEALRQKHSQLIGPMARAYARNLAARQPQEVSQAYLQRLMHYDMYAAAEALHKSAAALADAHSAARLLRLSLGK